MKYLDVCLACLLIVFAISTSWLIIVPQTIKQMNEFDRKAEEYFGTDDFKVVAQDIFVAYTEDGRQYPPKEVVNKYYRNKLIYYGIVWLGAFGLVGLLAWYIPLETGEHK